MFVIPNLNKEEKRIPISSVVLSSQRVPMNEALYNVAQRKVNGESANPLLQEGQKLVPSVTRVFSKSRPVFVYFQAYEPGTAALEPLVAFVSLYSGQSKILETQAVKAAEGMNNRLRTVAMKFKLDLHTVPPGRYECQVSVLNPAGQKAAFWRAPIAVVP